MTAPDFAAILNPWKVFTATDGHKALRVLDGAEILAAKVSELCPTCGGSACDGSTKCPASHHMLGCYRSNVHSPDHPCPDCPTIGRLLAIGVAVFGREIGAESPTFDGYSLGMIEDWTDGANWMLAALREVQT